MAYGENDQPLLALAKQRAFEIYLRFGHWPTTDVSAGQEAKALRPWSKPLAKQSRFYVWRSVGDDRVRASHALHDGRVFAWDEPPDGGHPGNEPNCRCWAEPYFGDPDVPDELQPLRHNYIATDTSTSSWTSIESLTRPDGSLAESIVTLRDGAHVRSRFWHTLVARTITLAGGGAIRIDIEGGRQKVYLGANPTPLFRSEWTVEGPRVTHAQQRVAHIGALDALLEPDFDGNRLDPISDPNPAILSPTPDLLGPEGLFGLLNAAFLTLQLVQERAPTSQGLADRDRPYIAFRAWSASGFLPVLVDAFTEEQLRQSCKYLPYAQR